MRRALIDYLVLDSLANDLENIQDITRILNSESPELGWRDVHPAPFETNEVLPALLRNLRAGLVSACVYSEEKEALVEIDGIPESLQDAWFRLTPRGRGLLESWEPPEPVG